MSQQNQVPQQSKLQSVWQMYFEKKYQNVLDHVSTKFTEDSIPEMLHLAGLSMVAGGKGDIGCSLLKSASTLMPQIINWYANASVVLCEKQPEDALKFATDGLNIHKHDVLYFCQGNAHIALKNFTEAKESFLKGLDINPKSIEILLNLGNTYRRLDNPLMANECYTKILEIEPKNHRARFNIASYKMAKGEHVENAKQMCLDYLKIEDNPEVAFMLSLFQLDEGDYLNGWKTYARRWESNLTLQDRKDIRRPMAESLEQIRNKTVVVFHEQGFGDSLQFCRYIPMLQEYTKNIILAVPTALMKLFQLSFPFAKCVNSRDYALPYDYEIPMLNLPMLFSTTMDTIPNELPYLKYSEKKNLSYVNSTGKLITPKIGLVWAGHARPDPDLLLVDKRRSMSYDHFLKIIDGFPLEMFGSLQLGEPAAQAENHPIVKLLNPTMDFAASAEIIAGLDLVLTVDTAPLHLASAIFDNNSGIKVLGLSRRDACWRYSKEKTSSRVDGYKCLQGISPWHKNTLMIYQEEKYNWEPVIEDVRIFLKNRYGF